MCSITNFLPLLHILSGLRDFERQIVIDHLNPAACNSIKRCVHTVLKQKKKIPANKREKLGVCFKQYKTQFNKILTKKGQANRKDLTKIGGNPLALILGTAIPILLDLIRGK